MRKKCLLVSFFNSNNLGDLLIADILQQFTSQYFDVDILSYEGKKVNNKGIIQEVSYTKRLIANIIGKLKLNSTNTKSHLFFLDEDILKEIEEKKYDLLVLGGGNMIMDLSYETMEAEWFGNWVKMGKRLGMQIIAISIGVGPFKTESQRLCAQKYLSQCEFVTFRDSTSKEQFKGSEFYNKSYVAIDPVFSLKKGESCLAKGFKKKKLIMNLIDPCLFTLDKKLQRNIEKGYNELIKFLLHKNYEIILFSSEANDYPVIRRVYKKNRENTKLQLCIIESVGDLLELYALPMLLIGCRMHSLIVASTQHIPVIGISWQTKVNSFFKIIDHPDRCYPISNLENSIQSIYTNIEMIEKNYEVEINTIAGKMQHLKESFQLNESIMREMESTI